MCYSKMTTVNLACCFELKYNLYFDSADGYLVKEISVYSGLHTQGEGHFSVGQIMQWEGFALAINAAD